MPRLELPDTAFSSRIDMMLDHIGRASCWLWALLLTVIIVNVALRYVFGEGRVELEEFQWHLNAIGFMISVAHAYRLDIHIRIDVVSSSLQPRTQAWIEFYGILILLLPFIALVLIYSVPFVTQSYVAAEISLSPGGLPYRWLIKGMLPIGFLLLLIAALSRLNKVWAYLFDRTS